MTSWSTLPGIWIGAIGTIALFSLVFRENRAYRLFELLFIVIVVCVLSYFFFSFEQKNPIIRGSARTGRLMMMFAFGAIFGSTVMARMALLIDRVWFLMHDWLHIAR